ncbi:MAG: YggS family pyridoxal phosphate-dependent enzyme [Bacteroidota bacterium]
MSVAQNLKTLQQEIPPDVTVVAVSKTKPVESVLEAYESGHKVFGENKVQELTAKFNELPKDIEWHMIGHLQRNKVKYIAPFVSLIHSVDSTRLLKEINKEAAKNQRIIDCLLQVHIAREESKFGLNEKELHALLNSTEYKDLKNIRIKGLMGMATFTNNPDELRDEFRTLKTIFEQLKSDYFIGKPFFSELSMGMSNDYKMAIEEGSTMVRIGSLIFGARNYGTP